MSISSVPGSASEFGSEHGSGKHPLKSKGGSGDAYLRVMRGGDAALAPNKDLGGGLIRANDEIIAIMDGASSRARSSLEETSGVIPVPEDDAEEMAADTDAYVLPALDYDDVHDTEPGIPEGCYAAECEAVPGPDSDENVIFDLVDNPAYD